MIRLRDLLIATLLVTPPLLFAAGADAAAGGGGAGATGSGDEIISSILAASSPGNSPSHAGGGSAPACHTSVLTDGQVVFLLQVAAAMPELLTASFLDAIDSYVGLNVVVTTGPPAPTIEPGLEPGSTYTFWELTVRICDGIADTMSVRERTISDTTVAAAESVRGELRRQTRLPPPRISTSPPPDPTRQDRRITALVGEPLFIAAEQPGPVQSTITLGALSVEVEATATGIELFSGQHNDVGHSTDCGGFGARFDPESTATPSQQARAAGACVLRFERATGDAVRDHWYAYALMHWNGRYRVYDARRDSADWVALDGLFSLSLFNVAVSELDTAIEDAPR